MQRTSCCAGFKSVCDSLLFCSHTVSCMRVECACTCTDNPMSWLWNNLSGIECKKEKLLTFFLCVSVQGGTPAAKMEVKTSLLDNMIGVGDMVLLEPLTEDSFLGNLRKRFDHNEIYVSLPFHICYVSITADPFSSSVTIKCFATLLLNSALKACQRRLVWGNVRTIFIMPLFLLSLTYSSLDYTSGTETETTATNQSINHRGMWMMPLNEAWNPELRSKKGLGVCLAAYL